MNPNITLESSPSNTASYAGPSATRRAAASGGFFAHHGVWAPGVRLFRRLRFRAKASLITLAFAIPLALLAWFYFGNVAAQIAFSSAERLGVAYNQALAPVLHAAERQRSYNALAAAAQADDQRSKLTERMARLAEEQALHGAALGTGDLHAAVVKAHAAMAPGDKAAHQAFIDALIGLTVQATDGSNLTLDPDIDTYYLMDGSLFRLPDLIDKMAELRDLSAAVAASDSATPEQTRRIGALGAIIGYMDANLAGGLVKTIGLHPELAAELGADAVRKDLQDFLVLAEQSATTGHTDGAPAVIAAGHRAADGLAGLQLRMFGHLDRLIAERVARMESERAMVTLLLLLMLPCALYLFYCFSRVMDGGMREVSRHLRAMTAGDLTTSPAPWGKDEAARLMLDLRAMQDSLRNIVGHVRSGAEQIVTASSEIANGSSDLSGRTETIASSIESSASAMDELSATVKNTAHYAGEAAEIASGNAAMAQRGGQEMDGVIARMQEIQQSSRRIADIIGTIDSIAFQTNILALNAAVEAARAGEQGRGFAVVAAEVRGLAKRSATAAQEIKALIGQSVQSVESGMNVVTQAGTTIGEIVSCAQRIHHLLGDIATGAREQSIGVGQVGEMVQTIDRMTQQNAALVEQTAAAAASLSDQAKVLKTEVAQFRLA